MKSPAMSSGALSDCSAPLAGGQKYVAVRLLTGDILYFVTETKYRVQHVFEQTINYLALNDAELFGLALKKDNEYQFMEQSTKLHKCASKPWKSQHGSGLDENGFPLLDFHLRVQLYVDCHLLISDKVSRHHYYLQLKENVLGYFLPVSEERAFLLAANALQADMGNYQAEKHSGSYFDPSQYFPFWVVKRYGEAYIRQHVPAMHRENQGQSRGEAQVGFIKEASENTAPHNLHLYKMRRKKGKSQDIVWLGVSAKSLEVFEDNGSMPKSHLSRFAWPDIAKLTFEKKKFEIRSVGAPECRRFVYYSNNEDIAKGLFWLCRLTHQFSMAVQHKEQELKKMELEGRKSFRESYIYSDTSELNWEPQSSELLTLSNGFLKKDTQSSNQHRISVISNASSNTTSGIVSDKVQSFCESEDELDMESIITSPSAGDPPIEREELPIKKSREVHKIRSASADFNSLVRSSVFQSLDCCQAEDYIQPNPSPSSSSSKVSSVQSELSSSDPTAWTYIRTSDPMPFHTNKSQQAVKKPVPCSQDNQCADFTTSGNLQNSFSSTNSAPNTYPNEAINASVTFRAQERTRIGVSSLNRVQKLPLTLFGSGQTGSEPNLNQMPMWPLARTSTFPADEIPRGLAQYYENSVSMLSTNGNLNAHRHSLATASADYDNVHFEGVPGFSNSKSTNSIPQDVSSGTHSRFVFIPPPPAYRTVSVGRPQQLSQVHSISLQTLQEKKVISKLSSQQTESQSVLDLHQLRQKSLDLDLPLMAALCNDRSLMGLPKTVPTCSRQRHVNAAKDMRRFSYTQAASSSDINRHHGLNEWPNHNGLPPEGAALFAGRPHSQSCPPDPPTILTSFLKKELEHAPSITNECVHAT